MKSSFMERGHLKAALVSKCSLLSRRRHGHARSIMVTTTRPFPLNEPQETLTILTSLSSDLVLAVF